MQRMIVAVLIALAVPLLVMLLLNASAGGYELLASAAIGIALATIYWRKSTPSIRT